jgi:hypothetical protein
VNTREHSRLSEKLEGHSTWKRWGPYVAERSWGTVREDYSAQGDAWGHLPHDHARSKAYRWGEDGLAAICDRFQLLVFSLAFWNERDPILKERLFGLVPAEGNHGEDVKEYYFYLDSTPTHSYMKYLYKYPQREYPYAQLIAENRARNGRGFEYELLDTGVFDEDRYFDIFVEYTKNSPEDIGIRIHVCNRGPEEAPLHLIPQLTFRNTWAWTEPRGPEPKIEAGPPCHGGVSVVADDSGAHLLPNLPTPYSLGRRFLYAATTHAGKAPRTLFTDNETNTVRLYGADPAKARRFHKDGFQRHIVQGEECLHPTSGTKAGLHYQVSVPPHGTVTVDLRLSPNELARPFEDLEQLFTQRRHEADEFYSAIHPPKATPDERLVQRQALAGMLWTKQIYLYDVDRWLQGDPSSPPPSSTRHHVRNGHWRHLNSMRIMSMPDKWEYPWFASWDLAFHCVALALVDLDFAKEQLWLMLFEQFQHPNGQIPAYEWEFSDLNPPVQAWAAWRVYSWEKRRHGRSDREFLERCFHKLLLNFTWWINRVDSEGNNLFEGGFLGLDNITVVDRSTKLLNGVKLEQSDATGWMGFFCLTMMRIALELGVENKVYEGLATKFFEHYVYVGAAMKHMGGREYSLWDETDGFFYDVLRYPNGAFEKFRVRSLVGVIPIYAIERLVPDWLEPFPEFRRNVEWFYRNRPELVQRCCYLVENHGQRSLVLGVVDETQLRRIIDRILDPAEFLSDWGIRSLSKFHADNPFRFGESEVRYEPAESDCKIKGGNSNWRGPIWFPTSLLLIESLRKLGQAFGDSFTVKTVSGEEVPLNAMAEDIANRMIRIFCRDKDGRRAVYGGSARFQEDPYWRDHILFYEYFHGDNGAGLGASHQTGWTGLVAALIDEWRR